MPVSCAAVLCVRNEAKHIHRAISDFVNQGIDVVVIDNGSIDQTLQICSDFLGHGLLSIEALPWKGKFDLSHQLEMKNEVIKNLNHDWVIHTDADEWMHSSMEGETLLEGITRISKNGYNVINFEEFVFLPTRDEEYKLDRYNKEILSYYYFSPHKQRLMRAWNRSLSCDNTISGGHKLIGEGVSVSPESFILRHYIVLSYEHAIQKYTQRLFSERDLAKDWHKKRLDISSHKLKLPYPHNLKQLDRWDSYNFDFSNPKKEHYWNWRKNSNNDSF